jgi:hypothetical protein
MFNYWRGQYRPSEARPLPAAHAIRLRQDVLPAHAGKAIFFFSLLLLTFVHASG